MGSMGSLLHSLTNPEQYCAVGSFSGPLMRMDMDRSKEYTDEQLREMVAPEAVELVKKGKAEGKHFPKYYVSTGIRDGLNRAKAFARFLTENGIEVTTNFEKDYAHEWRCWEENIEELDVYKRQPEDNKKDLEEVDAVVKEHVQFVPVKRINEILDKVLIRHEPTTTAPAPETPKPELPTTIPPTESSLHGVKC